MFLGDVIHFKIIRSWMPIPKFNFNWIFQSYTYLPTFFFVYLISHFFSNLHTYLPKSGRSLWAFPYHVDIYNSSPPIRIFFYFAKTSQRLRKTGCGSWIEPIIINLKYLDTEMSTIFYKRKDKITKPHILSTATPKINNKICVFIFHGMLLIGN